MKLNALEKTRGWIRSKNENVHLEEVELYYLAIVGHIQIDFLLMTTLVECWDPDSNTFHIPPSEMTMTLLNVFHIRHILIHT